MRVTLTAVQVEIDGQPILRGCDLTAEPGELIGLIGPNGSGKSTLLRTVYRALRPTAGAIHLGGDDVWGLSARDSALRTAVVAQEAPSDFDFTVEEVVSLGRTPHKRLFQTETQADRDLVQEAMRRVGITPFAHRVFSTLSGGEKQKTLLAKALAQQTRVLVLDEPTNHLDIKAQLELLELVRELGVTTLAALHELNLAAAYCDRIYVLNAGQVVASGRPAQVLTPEILADVFGVAAHGGLNPATGRLHLAFAPLAPRTAPERATGVTP